MTTIRSVPTSDGVAAHVTTVLRDPELSIASLPTPDDLDALIDEARRRPDLPILTGKAVAVMLHIGLKQVYAHITSGALRATKLGPRTLRIAFGDVLSFVADHQVGHTISILDGLDKVRVTERQRGGRGRLTSLRDAPDRLAA